MLEGITKEIIDSRIVIIKILEDTKSSIVEVEEATERSTMTKAMIIRQQKQKKSSAIRKIKMRMMKNKKVKRDRKLLNLWMKMDILFNRAELRERLNFKTPTNIVSMVVAAVVIIRIESFKGSITMTNRTIEARELTVVDKALKVIEGEVEASIEEIEAEEGNIATTTEETTEEDTAEVEETTTKSISTMIKSTTLGIVMMNGGEQISSRNKIILSRKRSSD